MKAGPNISHIASLVGDPARANMLTALTSGKALTATELAHEAGVTPQTASSHLAKLETSGLVKTEKQGRHRYFQLSGEDVAEMLEGLMGLAERTGHMRTRTGPRDPALRHARVCYDHLAGDLGVGLYDGLQRKGYITGERGEVTLTAAGGRALTEFGIDVPALQNRRRPLCKACLDWSARRSHLAGSLGTALLDRFYALRWARREKDSRVVTFTPPGERELRDRFAIRLRAGLATSRRAPHWTPARARPTSHPMQSKDAPSGPAPPDLATSAEAAAVARKTGPEVISGYLKMLPGSPGVYRMIDAAGDVIYVGKARSLKARVSNYARMGGHTNRIARMISATAGMEFVSTRTESEALLLEANLIKRFRPRFNVLLRDDKSFPYILIDARS